MDKFIEGATAFIIGFVATLFTQLMASAHRDAPVQADVDVRPTIH